MEKRNKVEQQKKNSHLLGICNCMELSFCYFFDTDMKQGIRI